MIIVITIRMFNERTGQREVIVSKASTLQRIIGAAVLVEHDRFHNHTSQALHVPCGLMASWVRREPCEINHDLAKAPKYGLFDEKTALVKARIGQGCGITVSNLGGVISVTMGLQPVFMLQCEPKQCVRSFDL